MNSLLRFAQDKLAALDAEKLRRRVVETERTAQHTARRQNQTLVSFSCNDYLNLSSHPLVKKAVIQATERYGAGAGASRLVTGNHPLYGVLEARLAAFKGTEAASVFGSGYLANLAIIPALVGAGDLVFIDALGHACMFAGARLSGAQVIVFEHNCPVDLARLLSAHRKAARHTLILTERVFSMDGDCAPLAELAVVARDYDAWLMTDDAHALGMLPPSDPHDVPLQMGTLSKAAGSYGGYLCAPAPVIDLMYSRARPMIYSTGLPPGVIAAAIAALDIMEAEPDLAGRPLERATRFTRALGLPDPASQIVPIVFGSATSVLSASQALAEAGYLVAAIRPPTVPDGTARLRIAFTAGHTDDEIDGLAAALTPLLACLRTA